MSNSHLVERLVEKESAWNWFYLLVFPLDLLFSPEDAEGRAYQDLKLDELFPIFAFLVPLAVLLTNTLSIGLGGMLFLYASIAFPLGILSAFHLKLEAGKGIEIALNLWAGMILTSLVLFLAMALLGFGASLDWDD